MSAVKKTKSSPKKDKDAKPFGEKIKHEHLDTAGEIAWYYGFLPQPPIEITKEDIAAGKDLAEGDYIDAATEERLPLHVEEKIALLRTWQEKQMWEWPQPVMLYFKSAFKNPFGGALKKNREGKDAKPIKDPRRFADLEIIGNQKSIAEATLLQTAFTILGEAGYTNLCVDINSIGDRECMQRFSKDLMNYYRKHINDMSAESRQLLKKDPFLLLASTEEAARELNSHAPSTLAYLSEASRCHFQEVLEYLEALDIPYRINNALIGNRKYCTETIFEIISQEEGKKTPETLGVGVRYDGLAKRLNFKKEVAGIGFTFLLKNPHTDLRKPVLTTKKPYVYFIQLGFEAKLLSLKAIELLRAAKIPVFQSLPKDKIGAQVSMAEKTHTPFTVIIGKKEALDKTAIVRYTESREQHSVPIGELAAYLKNLGL